MTRKRHSKTKLSTYTDFGSESDEVAESAPPPKKLNMRYTTLDIGPSGTLSQKANYFTVDASPKKTTQRELDSEPVRWLEYSPEEEPLDPAYLDHLQEETGEPPKRRSGAWVSPSVVIFVYHLIFS